MCECVGGYFLLCFMLLEVQICIYIVSLIPRRDKTTLCQFGFGGFDLRNLALVRTKRLFPIG